MNLKTYVLTCAIGLSVLLPPLMTHAQSTQSRVTSLTDLLAIALENDASRHRYFAQSQAMRDTGTANASLMDPKLKVGVGGLPVDSFKFDDDPMTNISVSLMQEFGRGNSLDLQQKKAHQQAGGMALKVAARELEVANNITQLWLELGYQQKIATLLQARQLLMQEMQQYIETNYAMGNSEAQDLYHAQLQVSKLEDQIQSNQQQQMRIVSQFSEWLGPQWLQQLHNTLAETPLPLLLPAQQALPWHKLNKKLANATGTDFYRLLNQHPVVKISEQTIAANQTQVQIAEASYSPKFAVEVMYAYRQADDMRGDAASDLLSAYLTVDIPLFTENSQDKKHSAAQYQVVAAKSDKTLLLSQMNAKINALLIDKDNITQRLTRYENTLLQQATSRTQATERGYQSNLSPFNDVIAAAQDELSLRIECTRLKTDLQLINAQLAYLLDGFNFHVTPPSIELNTRLTLLTQELTA